MLKSKPQKKSGFTLIELLMTLTLGVLVTVIIMAVVTPGMKYVGSVKRSEKLHSDAVFLLDNFTYWIKQGKNLNVSPSYDELEVVFLDSSSVIIKAEDEKIKINDVALTDENVEVSELNFTKMARSVRVNFMLRAKNAEENLSITTTIAQRN